MSKNNKSDVVFNSGFSEDHNKVFKFNDKIQKKNSHKKINSSAGGFSGILRTNSMLSG